MSTEITREGHASRPTQVSNEELTQRLSHVYDGDGLVESDILEDRDGDVNDFDEEVDQDVPPWSVLKDIEVDVFDDSDLEDRVDEQPPLSTATTPSTPLACAGPKRQSGQRGRERRASSSNSVRPNSEAPNLVQVDSEPEMDSEDEFLLPKGCVRDGESDDSAITFPEFNAEKHMENPEISSGMLFASMAILKSACRSIAIRDRRAIIFEKNDKKRLQCVCKVKANCSFYIWASGYGKDGTIQIKRLNLQHDCSPQDDLRFANPKFLANKYLGRFRVDPAWSLVNIMHTVKTDLKLTIQRMKAWRTKQVAMELLHGEDKKQFSRIFDYKATLETTNPGSTIVIELDRTTFDRMYVCLAALKQGFKEGCRKLVGVDGCFLRGVPGWQLLTATGIDPNDCIFPVAWAVVEKECKETWEWFLALFAQDLGVDDSNEWTFMSDRQKGLINAVQTRFPNAEHRFCVRHMYVNFCTKFTRSKRLKDLLWGCATSTYEAEYRSWMELMEKDGDNYKDGNHTPAQWLVERPVKQWCKASYRTEVKCEIGVNNISECFNSYIYDARGLPIISMFEDIRYKLMKRQWKKRLVMEKFVSDICPKPLKKLNKYRERAIWCTPTYNGNMEYEVQALRGKFVVDLRKRTCACGRWQLSGIPCEHGISCILQNKEQPEAYVHPCYKKETYMKAYQYSITPQNDPRQWIRTGMDHVRAPTFEPSKRGRKTTKRRLEVWEVESRNKRGTSCKAVRKLVTITCTQCGVEGHNKRFHNKKASENEGPSAAIPNTTQKKVNKRVQTYPTPPMTPASNLGSPRAAPLTGPSGGGMIFMPTPSIHQPAIASTRSKSIAASTQSPAKNTLSKTGAGRGSH